MHPNSLLSHCFERTRHLFITYGCKRERNAPICFFTPRNLAFPAAHAWRTGHTSPHAFLTGPLLTGALRYGMHDLCGPFASSPGTTGRGRAEAPLVRELALAALWGIAQEKVWMVTSETLQLMHRYQTQIRSYPVRNHQRRLPHL